MNEIIWKIMLIIFLYVIVSTIIEERKKNKINTEKHKMTTYQKEIKNTIEKSNTLEQQKNENPSRFQKQAKVSNKIKNEIKELPKNTQPNLKIENKKYILPNIKVVTESEKFKKAIDPIFLKDEIILPIGIENNEIYYENILNIQNMLIGGTTCSGKSSFIYSLINSFLATQKPEDLKLVLIDTKKIEMIEFNGLPNLLCPVITDAKKSYIALEKIINIIKMREEIFYKFNSKDIMEYNKQNPENKLYRIVIIIDDYSIISQRCPEINDIIEVILQNSENMGINLIFSTSNPTNKAITQNIRSCMTTRVCFKVPEKKFSKFFIDTYGAEEINEDNVYLYKSSNNQLKKLKSIIITNKDSKKIASEILNQNIKPMYSLIEDDHTLEDKKSYDDPLYNEIVKFAIETGKISASLIQRRFKLGYNRAARIVDLLEEKGIIGPQNGSNPREVIIKR